MQFFIRNHVIHYIIPKLMKKYLILAGCMFLFLAALPLTACGDDKDNPDPNDKPAIPPAEVVHGKFARGADVSWLTQLEAEGEKFYSPDGKEKECMQLLRDDCGVNAIRLRVWVNPKDGWNNIDDVMVKARRADALGMRLMIDFHFSDTWADPGHQEMPEAWKGKSLNEVKSLMTAHIHDMLGALKKEGIPPAWVQIGNETRTGMMYPLGKLDADFAELVNTGYDAVKADFPGAIVIVHCDEGDNGWHYRELFGKLKAAGAKYDMIGMSLYPDASNWEKLLSDMVNNIRNVTATYGKPVMICEIGMPYNQGEAFDRMLSALIDDCASLDVKGVFYWEPEAPSGYNGGYDKGCFINGTPTQALDTFKKNLPIYE